MKKAFFLADSWTNQITIPFPTNPQRATATVMDRKIMWSVFSDLGASAVASMLERLHVLRYWAMVRRSKLSKTLLGSSDP